MSLEYLKLEQLVPSRTNVRRQKCDPEELAELAATILAHGVVQNLTVQPCDKGFEVVAGKRRHEALKLLRKHDQIEEGYLVPCTVLEIPDDAPIKTYAAEVSLAENVSRIALHPADQFEAFAKLHKKGKGLSIEQIATRFGYPALEVEKRLRLGRVHPELIKLYRLEKLTLETLMAFTVTDDQNRQMAAYEAIKKSTFGEPSRHEVKSHLMQGKMMAQMPIPTYVTLKKYEAAGGTVTRDLFSETERGSVYIDDPAFMIELAVEKLDKHAKKLEKQGWKWARAVLENSHDEVEKFDQIEPDDEGNFTDEQKAVSGAIVTIDYSGKIDVEGGLIDPQDEEEAAAVVQEQKTEVTHRSTASPGSGYVDPEKKALQEKGLSMSLAEDLRLIRGNLTRWTLAQHAEMAFNVLVYQMARDLLGSGFGHYDKILDIDFRSARSVPPGHKEGDDFDANDLGGTLFQPMVDNLTEKHAGWIKSDPDVTDEERWRLFMEVSADDKDQILNICVALMFQNQLACDYRLVGEIEEVTKAIKPPFQKFRPTAETFWKRLSKGTLLEIAAEIGGSEWANSRKMLKKGELADLMGKLFAPGADWGKYGLTEAGAALLENWTPEGFIAE